MRVTRLLALPLAALLLAGCDDDGTGVRTPAAIAPQAGNGQNGTVGAPLGQPLTVRVTDAGGAGVGGATVAWQVTGGGGGIAPTTTTTDAQGNAQAVWTLGTAAGPNTATATVAGFTATFTATAAAGALDAVVVTPAAPTIAAGQTVQLGTAFRDAYGNATAGGTVTWSTGNPSVATVSGTGVVTGVSAGQATIFASVGSRTGSTVVTVAGVLPAAPTNLGAFPISSTRIDLTWTDNATGESGHEIQYRPVGTQPWLAAGATGLTTTFSHTGLTPSTAYEYRVRACNATVCGPFSESAFATTLGAAGAPGVVTRAPSGFTVSSVVLNGELVTRGLATTAWFVYGTSPTLAGGTATPPQSVGSGTGSILVSQALTGLAAGTYYYRLVAQNSAGTSEGNVVSFQVGPPTAPVLTGTFSPTDYTPRLSYTYDPGIGVTGTRIERRKEGTATWAEFSVQTSGSAGNFQAIDFTVPIDAAATWFYRVTICTVSGCSTSNEVGVAVQPLAAPTNLTATATPGQVSLTWQDNAPNEFSYQIHRTPTFGGIAFGETGPNATFYADTRNLTPGISYTYRVQATYRYDTPTATSTRTGVPAFVTVVAQ